MKRKAFESVPYDLAAVICTKGSGKGMTFGIKGKVQMAKTWMAKLPVYKVRRKEMRLSQSFLSHLNYSGLRYGSIAELMCGIHSIPTLKGE